MKGVPLFSLQHVFPHNYSGILFCIMKRFDPFCSRYFPHLAHCQYVNNSRIQAFRYRKIMTVKWVISITMSGIRTNYCALPHFFRQLYDISGKRDWFHN